MTIFQLLDTITIILLKNGVIDLKEKTCCFTGHRALLKDKLSSISNCLEKTIIKYINEGYRYFGSGGALGFDTLAAETIIQLKERYPYIKLILVLPCISQTKGWMESDIRKYNNIKLHADKIVYVSKEYTKDCMFKRNRHLVNYSSLCICYLDKTFGGTAYTVNHAKKNNLKIENIANNDV